MTRTRGFEAEARASAGTARARASEPKNARRNGPFTVVRIVSGRLAVADCVCDSRVGLPTVSPQRPMKPVLAAAVLALAAPGTAAAAGLSLASRDLRGGAPIAVKRFQLVGLHWRGPGKVLFRTRSGDGRWSAWHQAAPENDDLPDRGTEGRRTAGWRLGNPFWVGSADRVQYRTVGRVS